MRPRVEACWSGDGPTAARATSVISPRAGLGPFDAAKRIFDWAVVGMRCWVFVPIAIAAVLAVVATNYWDPMFSNAIGLLLLGAGVISIGIGVALVLLARRVAGPSRGRLLAGVGIVLLAFVIQFFTLWIVFLGPAVVILLSPGQT